MREVEGQSIDSYSRRWKADNIAINFDYGIFSDPLALYSKRKSYRAFDEKIDNNLASVVSFQKEDGCNFIGAYFPDLDKNKFNQTIKLTLVVEVARQTDRVQDHQKHQNINKFEK
jgi:hypothetical protein